MIMRPWEKGPYSFDESENTEVGLTLEDAEKTLQDLFQKIQELDEKYNALLTRELRETLDLDSLLTDVKNLETTARIRIDLEKILADAISNVQDNNPQIQQMQNQHRQLRSQIVIQSQLIAVLKGAVEPLSE